MCQACTVHFNGLKRAEANKLYKPAMTLEVADRLYQTAHKDRVTLPRVAWLRRPAPEASSVPRSALISPQSGATLIGSAKSRRRI